MAMRLFSPEEFESELLRRGCEKRENHSLGTVWRHPDGVRHFLVPHPEESGRYPDWMLDDLIRRLDLPQAPTDQ